MSIPGEHTLGIGREPRCALRTEGGEWRVYDGTGVSRGGEMNRCCELACKDGRDVNCLCPACAEELIEEQRAKIAALEAQMARYAPTDGDDRSTDELAAVYFARGATNDKWASLFVESNGDIMAEWGAENPQDLHFKPGANVRAALIAAMKEGG